MPGVQLRQLLGTGGRGMNWRYLYCPLCANRGKIVWGKQVFCQDCETADKPVRFKEERVMDTGASLPVRTPQAPAEEAEE